MSKRILYHSTVTTCLAAIAALIWLSQESATGQQPPGEDNSGEALETGMLPASPQDLLPALPGKLNEWTLVRSTAERRYGTWMEARVVREFERQLPAEETEDQDAGSEVIVTARTRLSIVDTARHADAIAVFADFSPGKEDGFERKLINGNPAFVIAAGDSEKEIEMLVAGRFVVRVFSTNQPESFLEEWLDRIDLGKLSAIPDTETVELPESLILTHIDQLDPGKNSAYQLATSSSSRVSQELAEDDAWLEEVLGEIPDIPQQQDPNDTGPVR